MKLKKNISIMMRFKGYYMIIILTLLSYITRFMVDWNFKIQSFLWFGCSLIPLYHVVSRHPSVAKEMRIWFLIDFIAFFNILVNGSHEAVYAGTLFVAQCWGAFLYCERKDLFPVEQISVAFILYLLYRVCSTPKMLISSWQYGIKLSSRVWQNTVSIFLCEFLSYSILYRYYKEKDIKYPLFIVSCIVAKICDGMGGILSTTAFLAGSFLIDRKRGAVDWKRVLLLSAMAVMIFALFMDFGEAFSQATDDNGRFYIWSHYIGCIDALRDLVFGADVSSVPFLVFENNMHNTFMNYHFCYGLIPFVFFLWRHFTNFAYCIRKRKHWLLLVMCVTSLRAFTDEAEFAFGGIWTAIWLMARIDKSKSELTVLSLRQAGQYLRISQE